MNHKCSLCPSTCPGGILRIGHSGKIRVRLSPSADLDLQRRDNTDKIEPSF